MTIHQAPLTYPSSKDIELEALRAENERLQAEARAAWELVTEQRKEIERLREHLESKAW